MATYKLSLPADEINSVLSGATTKAASAVTGNIPVFSAGRDLLDSGRSPDSYALALVTTDGPSSTLSIYPDAGSNLVVTAHGYTDQPGSGNPSPTNIRPITTGGIALVELTFNGSEDWRWGNNPETYGFYVVVDLKIPAVKNNTVVYCANLPSNKVLTTPGGAIITRDDGLTMSIVPAILGISDVNAWKSYLTDNPLTVWYPPADKSRSTGLYSPVVLDGVYSRYTSPCINVSAHMCNGDNASSNGVIVNSTYYTEFNGQENWYLLNNEKYPQLIALDLDFQPTVNSVVSSHAVNSSGATKPGAFYTLANTKRVHINPTGGQWGGILSGWTDDTLVDMWKAWLKGQADAGTPVQMIVTRSEPATYTASPYKISAMPDGEGKVTVTGEKTVSATYNKSLSHALAELQAAIIALGANQ